MRPLVYIADDVFVEARRDAIKYAIAHGATADDFRGDNCRTGADVDEPAERAPSLKASKRATKAPSAALVMRGDGSIVARQRAPRAVQPAPRANDAERDYEVPIGEHTYRVRAARGYDAFKLARQLHEEAGRPRPNAREWTARVVH
jgi:hypothetical protein